MSVFFKINSYFIGNAKVDPKVEAECMNKNQEWESWKRKYNITHWKPAKRSKQQSTSNNNSVNKNTAASPSSGIKGKVGKKRGPKGGKSEARLKKKGQSSPVILA